MMRWDEGDGFGDGLGMDGLECSGKNLGKEVGTYLAYLTLKIIIFFLWGDGWLDGDLLMMHGLKNGTVDEMDVFG